ncbi:hypothetical protein GUITHDRAFT_104830 [Guillardia theta CCMP2712]|uniref:TLDc domain-containing protein n=1 Tax=Guillardia theta (strain CCMP2712) TaxID=905079 RepID=L1JMB2_GUITC|nr:hypothetical protein GUITHDRAFT_104830 [Guillardia theta CCMP2712]EKX49300.1 hypothetical protein GUITHDRAFT_104830 [Guillardia theta CCMP2712]|eukprot:XP_005836280.1 hypothetical protein GUITHDRAFT_104830 [Guillardia theta CCMP2712]
MVARPGKKRKVNDDDDEVKVVDDVFETCTSAQHEVINLAASIAARRAELEQEKAKMLSESLREQGIKQEKDSLLLLRPSSIVKLNVGGTKIDVKRSTVTGFPSKLRWMLSGRWDHVYKHDSEGRILLDYDASWLEPIINYLRELAMQQSPMPMEPPKVDGENEIGFRYLTRALGLDGVIVNNKQMDVEEGLLKSWARPPMTQSIASAVGCGKERCDFKLLYRASRDGFSIGTQQQKCQGESNTLTIVRDTDGNVFGGFSDAAREFNGSYSRSGKSFLFKLSSGEIQDPAGLKLFRVLPGKEEKAVLNDPQSYAAYGDGADLRIANECQSSAISRCNLGHTYDKSDGQPHELTGGKPNFQVAELEVWKVSLELDKAKEAPPTAERIPRDCSKVLGGLTKQLDALEAFQYKLLTRGVELCQEARVLDEEAEDLKAEKAYMKEVAKAISQEKVVFFNVGGRKLYTMKQTLALVQGSKLYKRYASGNGEVPEGDLDDDGDIFLDVNPYCFGKIVSHLRTRRLQESLKEDVKGLPPAMLQVRATEEASFKRMLAFFELDWDELEGRNLDPRLPDSIFSRHYSKLQPYLSNCTVETKWRLVWRGSKDGYSAAEIHKKLSQPVVQRQLVMVKDGQGNMFGGFTDVWQVGGTGYIHSASSFLFSLRRAGLTDEQSFKICGMKPGMNNHGMLLGDGNIYHFGQRDLIIVTNCNKNSSSSCGGIGNTFNNHGVPHLLTSGAPSFKVDELEIWTLA